MNEPWELPQLLQSFPGREADVQAWFRCVARLLLSETTLRVVGDSCQIREVEFYFYTDSHPDPFAHCAPQQRCQARWYLHRQGRGYRGGSFKGIDLTFGPPSAFGGILIRSLSLPDGRFINGSSLCVDYMMERTGSRSVAVLDHLIWDESVFASNPLRLEPMQAPFDAPIWETARVGLSLRCVERSPEMKAYFARPYRFLNATREIKKGRQQLVVAMHRQGKTKEEILEFLAIQSRTVSAWLSAYEKGLKRHRAENDQTKLLPTDDLCGLLGMLQS